MKKVLVIGQSSYIGCAFEKWTKNYYSDLISVDIIGSRGKEWKNVDFHKYDTILHVAGIAHISETKISYKEYLKVNRDFPYEVAKMAKERKVKQFIFVSTMSVYGVTEGVITEKTPVNPISSYGKSKYQAEKLIEDLQTENFLVAIVRPPMVYGPNSPGNYKTLSVLSKLTPFIPMFDNSRSMIFIDNLSDFFCSIILNLGSGKYCPQNKDYVSTSTMMSQIRMTHNKKIIKVPIPSVVVGYLSKKSRLINKVCGTLVYEYGMKDQNTRYKKTDFLESITKTEREI